MRVDLPAPFSPSKAWTSPGRKSNETPFSARTAPKDLVTADNWSRGFNPLVQSRLTFHQNFLLVFFNLAQPGFADGHAGFKAIQIPHRAEGQGPEFFQQREAGGVIAAVLEFAQA